MPHSETDTSSAAPDLNGAPAGPHLAAETSNAAVEIKSILRIAAEQVQAALQHAQANVNAVLASSAQQIDQTLCALEQSAQNAEGYSEFETMPATATANAHGMGQGQAHCSCTGLHPGDHAGDAHG